MATTKRTQRFSTNGHDKTPNKKEVKKAVGVSPPNMETISIKIIGTTPYVQHKFSRKAKIIMIKNQEAGSTTTKGKKREPKDFDELYKLAQYQPSGETWPLGAIPATQIRAAMIAACRVCGFQMTTTKQLFDVVAHGYDPDELVPLIRITKGKPRRFDQAARNDNGSMDIRTRPIWDPGWEAVVTIVFDADMMTKEDVANLLLRAGLQVGIGEGRMASRKCAGLGWGGFRLASNPAEL